MSFIPSNLSRLADKGIYFVKKIQFIEVIIPDAEIKSETLSQLSMIMSKIQLDYGSLSFTPFSVTFSDITRAQYHSILSQADLAVVLEDHENINIPFDYSFCQRDKQSPLIISEFLCASNLMESSAFKVNPWNIKVSFS